MSQKSTISKRLFGIAVTSLLVLGSASTGLAQDGPAPESRPPSTRLFGSEFEFAGKGNRVEIWENHKYENYRRVMEVIVNQYGGDPKDIKRVNSSVPHPSRPGEVRNLFHAEWTDTKGRTWKVEPEYVDSRGLDGYEVVSPPLKDAAESQRVFRALQNSGLLREGIKSGAHIHIDARDLIQPNGRAGGLVNTILMHERFEPLLRELFNPVRGSGLFNKNRGDATSNRFARSLAVDHPKLLQELSELPAERQTKTEIERIFRKYNAAEMKAHGISELDAKSWKTMWKYRSLNVINVLNINEALPAKKGTVEFRMNDLPISDLKLHEAQVKLYQAMVDRAKELAQRGQTLRFDRPLSEAIPGEDPVRSRGPKSAHEARTQIMEMIEFLGLKSADFKPLIERAAKRSGLPSEAELQRRLDAQQAKLQGSNSGSNSAPQSLELKLSAELKAERASALTNLIDRANSLARSQQAEAGRPLSEAYTEAELKDIERALREGRAPKDGAFKNKGVEFVSAKDGQLKLKINSSAEAARSLSLFLSEQVQRGQVGPWTNNQRSQLNLSQKAQVYFEAIEGRSLSANEAKLFQALQGSKTAMELLKLPLNNLEKAEYLPERVQRDLRFRQQDVLRSVAALAQEGPIETSKAVEGVREIVQKWAQETRVARYLQRSLIADNAKASTSAELLPKISRAEVTEAFNAARRASQVEGAKIEISNKAGQSLEWLDGKRLRIPSSIINEVHTESLKLPKSERAAYRRTALGLLFAEKLAQARGLKGQRATSEAMRLVEGEARFRTVNGLRSNVTVESVLHGAQGEGRLSRRLLRFAQQRLTLRSASEAQIKEMEALKRFRRADGTIRMKQALASGSLNFAKGSAHFALALFLKELAVVVQTGDRARIDEFFDGLMTVGFFETYALFSAGAAGANVLYGKTLEKWIRPKFVSGILRTNIVLATGMALPEIYHGTFEGKAFAINVASLGLSSIAVKGAMGGIKWVYNLKSLDKARKVTSQIQKYRRFAKVGGWFYTAAETAVVLYFGEEIAKAVNKFLDDRAARDNIEKATKDFFGAVSNGQLTDEEFAEALAKFDSAHADHRNYLYQKLNQADQIYFARMARAAEEAKNLADKRKVLADKLAKFKNLRDTVLRNPKYNSVEDYLNDLAARDEAKVNKDVEMYMDSYNKSREQTIEEIYKGNKRSGAYLTDANTAWVAQGAKVGAANDPLNGRTDWFANRSRQGAIDDVLDSARDISFNRLQAYDDQIKALEIARAASKDTERRALIGSLMDNLKNIKDKDSRLIEVNSQGASALLSGELNGR